MDNFGLYVIITNPTLPYNKIAEICVKHNIKYLQLREKDLSDRELIRISHIILDITKNSQTQFIMNDRTDLAKVLNCGLHLGQDDLPIEEARKMINNLPIGLSTHSIIQANEALEKNPHYIGFGPVYKTPTKAKADPVVGLNLLKEVISFSTVPVVAIGGIDDTNLDSVLDTGAKNLAVVRYLMQSNDFENRLKYLQSKIEERRK